MELFTDDAARGFLETIPPDNRAELLDEVPANLARRLLRLLSPDDRQKTLNLLGYADATAGRAMTPDFIDLHHLITVSQALEKIRRLAMTKETIYMSYVIDSQRRLLGTVSLKDLVLADPETRVSEMSADNRYPTSDVLLAP
jgi:magnesium transporter